MQHTVSATVGAVCCNMRCNMVTKELLTLKLDDLIPYENNPRKNEIAVPDVVASIEQCTDLDPIEIDEDNVILSGHTRLKAMQELGYETADVIRYTGLTEEQKRKYRLLTNKTGERAEWDLNKLDIELAELDFDGYDFDFDGGFSIDDIEEVNGYDKNNDDREYFEKTFTFPIEKKEQITKYLKKHYDETVSYIMEQAESNY